MPVLYADSGGTKELVGSGIGIKDNIEIKFENQIPKLNVRDLEINYFKFKYYNYSLKIEALKYKRPYYLMLKQYFDVFKDLIKK